jgi:hypothetical protein
MRKLVLAALAAMGLAACNFPANTKMEEVGETQMKTAAQPAPADAAATSEREAAARSANAKR